MKKYHVEVSAAEGDARRRVRRRGKTRGRSLTRARILLKADGQLADEESAEAGGTSGASSERTRPRFVMGAPHVGWRHLVVTERRTQQDFASQRKWLVEDRHPDAEGRRVGLDQLTTHRPASLYATFPPADARRIRMKLAFHSTPKPGSGPHMAEIELSVLQRPCLARRRPDVATLTQAVQTFDHTRHTRRAPLK